MICDAGRPQILHLSTSKREMTARAAERVIVDDNEPFLCGFVLQRTKNLFLVLTHFQSWVVLSRSRPCYRGKEGANLLANSSHSPNLIEKILQVDVGAEYIY